MTRTKALLCSTFGRDLAALMHTYFEQQKWGVTVMDGGFAGNWELCDQATDSGKIYRSTNKAIGGGYLALADHLASKAEYNWNNALFYVGFYGHVELLDVIIERGAIDFDSAFTGACVTNQSIAVFSAIHMAKDRWSAKFERIEPKYIGCYVKYRDTIVPYFGPRSC